MRKKALRVPGRRACWADRRASAEVGMEVCPQNSRDTNVARAGFRGRGQWLRRDGLKKVVGPDQGGPGKDTGQAVGSFS